MTRLRAAAPVLAGLGLALLWLPGCAAGRCDPALEDCGEDAATDTYDGPMALRRVATSCGAGERSVDVVLEGAAASASVTFASHDEEGSETWSERHRVPVASADAAGWWQARWVSLAVADTSSCDTLEDCGGRYAPGERTLFACTGGASGGDGDDTGVSPAAGLVVPLTVTLELVDAADREVQVCYTWGDRADLSGGCLPWEPQ